MKSLVNGKFSNTVDIMDRGFLYGDGVFETLAVQQRRIALWPQHMQRLRLACEKLAIDFPGETLLIDEVKQLLASCHDDVTLRITLTRGVGQRGYRPAPNAVPSRIISLHEMLNTKLAKHNNYNETGINLRCCETRLAKSSLAGLKHLNRLEQVLAQSEWQPNEDIQEGLMLDYDDNVIEGTMSNVFIVKNNQLITPDLSHAGVAGVMRRCIIDTVHEHGIAIDESMVKLSCVKNADEVFVSNSVIGIWPVKYFDSKHWPAPGKLTTIIMQNIEIKNKISGLVI
jgi:4-amino-4-deoxychorismate lyase